MSQLKQNGVSKNKAKKNKSKEKVKVFTKKKPNLKNAEANIIEKLQAQYETIDSSSITKFGDFPLSQKTLKGLRECGYHKPTEIQKETIGLALQGKDILGAAQTGSGKTLAFLIPIIEKLYCQQWTKLDGVGALVITPTRELAYQIFETLRRVGEHHDFSAGLIIGGKDLKFEKNRMDQCNIIICTPGRLLQHMDQNPLFDCVNMQILVLDEADRCLDMGFEQTMNAIIANLPPKRQTLLFSATQTRSVRDLARLSLKDPSYISVHENSEFSTPKELSQSYMVCELQDKVSILWSFLRNHTNKKIIVFFSSCKQAKYTYEIFCKLRPGISLMALYGTLHQLRRMDIYDTFCKKQSAVLFATDIAARGLDFPAVHWVVQVDCPEDVATYIHRVGRTARYHRGGESLLMLLPSEVKMVEKLKEKKIPIEKIEVNPLKLYNPVQKMEAYLSKDSTLKDTAQRAFVAYAKAVFLMKDKEVFDVQALNTDAFARSLGLTVPPRIRFLQRLNARTANSKKNTDTNNVNNKTYFHSDSEGETENKLSQNKNESEDSGLSGDDEAWRGAKPEGFQVLDDDGSEDERVFQVIRQKHTVEPPANLENEELETGGSKNSKPITKAAAVKKILKNKVAPNKKIVFADDDEPVKFNNKDKISKVAQQFETEGVIDLEKIKLIIKEEDKFDNQRFREKIKAKHKEEKRKLKEKKKKEEEEDKDEFGESESEDEPDLSWMPDPDKIYGEKTEEEVERLMQGTDSESEEEEEESQLNDTKKLKKRKTKGKKNEEEDEDSSEQEEVEEKPKKLGKQQTQLKKKQRSDQDEAEESEEEFDRLAEGSDSEPEEEDEERLKLDSVKEKPKKLGKQQTKLKKKQRSDEEEEDESEEEFDRLAEGSDSELEEEDEERLKLDPVKENSKKRKAKGSIDNLETVLNRKKKHKIEEISSSLSVNEAEQLAMLLLRNK